MSVNSSRSSETSGSFASLQGSSDFGRSPQITVRRNGKRIPNGTPVKPMLQTSDLSPQTKIESKIFQTPEATPKGVPKQAPKSTPRKPLTKKIGPKAISMEDLTPTKRCKGKREDGKLAISTSVSTGVFGLSLVTRSEKRAAMKIGRFMITSAWRRRRDEVRCLRRTLECQMSCSERLRLQSYTLKSLLESDNRKVKVALRELDRLKLKVKEKEQERLVLDNEKRALEQDVLAEQDRASLMQIDWNNCRMELDRTRGALLEKETLLQMERDMTMTLSVQLIQALDKASSDEEEAMRLASALERAQHLATALREETEAKEQLLEVTIERLEEESRLRARTETERAALQGRVSDNALETGILKLKVGELRTEVERLAGELQTTRDQLACWPAPLTKLVVLTRTWLRSPQSLREALWWNFLPARHGC